MNFSDTAQLSSFSYHPKQKGLLTFYQQQWNLFSQNQTRISQNSTLQCENILRPKMIQNKQTSQIKHIPLKQVSNKQLLGSKNEKNISIFTQISKQTLKPLKILNKPKNLYSQSMHLKRKYKQSRIECIKKNIFEKIQRQKIKEEKIYQSIHIKNYPFEEKQYQDLTVNQLKNQVSNIRIKKGSSFKGFHRENVSISSIGLDRGINLEQKKYRQKNIMIKSVNYDEKIFQFGEKNVSNYVFPIFDPNEVWIGKDNEVNINKKQSKNSPENKLMKLRFYRNSDLPSIYIKK